MIRGSTALALILSACGGDNGGAPNPIDGGGSGSNPGGGVTFHQVEQLARPGINEALLFTTDYLNGYNATAPSFAGAPTDTLNAVVGEAKTTLRAIYLGVCFINGAAGLTVQTGLQPAGSPCHAVGTDLFNADLVTQTQASIDASSKYADTVFGLFEPDVMRIDTTLDKGSNYLTLCGSGPDAPLLCGGRQLTDDTIDITYDFLFDGAAEYFAAKPNAQFVALTSDGVSYSTKNPAMNVDGLSTPDANNAAQGHPDVLATFPYSAPPF
jgi:hypothetical protein